MRKQLVGLILTAIIVFSVSGYGLYVVLNETGSDENVQENEFEWTVQVGDELSAFVNVTDFYDDRVDPGLSYTNINFDDITISIIHLPTLPNQTDGDSFMEDVVLPIKVNCDSLTLDDYHAILNELLSLAILPSGEWEWFDSLYNDTENEDTNEQFITRIDDNILFFQWRTTTPGIGINTEISRWKVWVDITTGLPIRALYLFDSSGCFHHEITIDVTIFSNN